jgi:ribosomal protein L19
MAAAFLNINPPKHVRLMKRHVPFFNSVIAEYAKAEWTDHTLEIAALLARSMGEMEEEQFQLMKEGSTMRTKHGTPVVNPRKTTVQMYAGTVLALRRSLCLNARAQGSDNADILKRKSNTKAIENLALAADDDLINRPLN